MSNQKDSQRSAADAELEREGVACNPEDSYTAESVRQKLSQLLQQLAESTG